MKDLITKIKDAVKEYSHKGGTRKIAEPAKICRHPEHNPPMFRYFPPGTYEHTCPACGKSIIFTVPLVTL